MAEGWTRVEIACRDEVCDELAAEIADRFGAAVEYTTDRIFFYLEADADSKGRLDELERLLGEARLIHGNEAVGPSVTRSFEDTDWAERWKEYFKPFRVGRRFLIAPSWEKVEPAPDDILLCIDPGQAFGTGQHETTRLCLEWLEDFADRSGDVSGLSVLDVGTGSGILAMGAAYLGFGDVVGVDLDPVAVRVANENITLNGLEGRASARSGSAGVEGRYDVVIANIQAIPLIDMAGDLAARMKATGRLTLSGILNEHWEAVWRAFEERNLTLNGRCTDGEWCLLEFSGKMEEYQP